MQQQYNTGQPDFSSAIMHGQQDERVHAKFQARYFATAIDAFILSLALGFLQSFGGDAFTLLYPFISLAYYMVLPSRWEGQTLGKKILGIQIISTSGEDLGFKQMFLREGPYKFISALLLGYGFLRALFAKDAKALHDVLANTRVVRVHAPGVESGFSWKRSLIITGTSLATICFCVYFVIFRSSLLANTISEKLSLAGVEVQNLRGNLSTGFDADLIRSVSPSHEVEFVNPRIHIDSNLLKLMAGKLRVREISVESGKLLLGKKMPSIAPPEIPKEDADQIPPAAAPLALAGANKKEGSLNIDLFNIKNLEFGFLGSEDRFLLNQFSFTGLKIQQSVQSWDGINLKSTYADLYVPKGSFVDGSLSMTQKIQGLVKKEGFPKYLVNDLDLNLKLAGSMSRPDVELDAARGTLDLRFSNGKIQGQFKSFHPFHYFANVPPIYEFTGNLEPGLFAFMPNFKGSAKIRNKVFHFDGSLMRMRGQHRSYQDRFMVTVPFIDFLMGKKSPLEIENANAGSSQDALARLYFNRDFAQLPPKYQRTVESDSRHFKLKEHRDPSDMMLEMLKASLERNSNPLERLRQRQEREAEKFRKPASSRQ